MEIEQPTNAYAFVDISLLRFEGEVPTTPTVANNEANNQPVTSVPTAPETTPTVTTETISNNTETAVAAVPAATSEPTNNVTVNVPLEPVVTQPDNPSTTVSQPEVTTTLPANTEPQPPVNVVQPETAVSQPESSPLAPIIAATPEATNVPAATTANAASELPKVAPPLERKVTPPGKRIVRREGIVRATASIQAPTWYELVNAETKKRINYLFGDSLEINLKDYRGQRVVVSGEELIDSRWPNTPIMDLQSLDVLPDESR
jgi:hypothetical protein